MAYSIVVDSSSDLPEELSSKLEIFTVPMPVYINNTAFREGVDLFPDEFYAGFGHYTDLPKTSQPNPNDLLDVYEKVLAEGNEVVAIHLSSGLSSTCQTALMVKDMCSAPEKVHIIDSLGASLGFGLQALYASEMAKEAVSWSDLEEKILDIRNRMHYIFTLDTLEYLVKGGRVSKTAGFIAGLLDVKPILHINAEGKIDIFNKVRSRKAALRKLVSILEESIIQPEDQIIGISHAVCPEDVAFVAEEIQSRMQVKQIIIGNIGCVIGSHVGPGTLSLFYLAGSGK